MKPTGLMFVCCWFWPLIFSNILVLLLPSLLFTLSVASLQPTHSPTNSIDIAISPSICSNSGPVSVSSTGSPLKTRSEFPIKFVIIAPTVSVLVLFFLFLVLFKMGCLPKSITSLKRCKQRKGIAHNQEQEAVDNCEKKRSNGCDSADVVIDCGSGTKKYYSWEEIKRVTFDFSRVIGIGGFSTVYFAELPCSTSGAVKIQSCSDHLSLLFKQELDILLSLQHRNIVKFLGYSDNPEEGALVFEYVQNGSLQDYLNTPKTELKLTSGKYSAPESRVLPWRKRTALAYQLAEALEYLHEKCALPIVHGDIKASNILLDEQFNCKLCDFGSANMGFSATVALSSSRMKRKIMVGSPGYTDPHYLRTGIASKKNDMYGFGVIVLELVTGMEAYCVEKNQLLTSVMAPALTEIVNASAANVSMSMVDPRLDGDFDAKEVKEMLSIAAMCILHSPSLRPSASQILQIMKENIPSISFLFSPTKY